MNRDSRNSLHLLRNRPDLFRKREIVRSFR